VVVSDACAEATIPTQRAQLDLERPLSHSEAPAAEGSRGGGDSAGEANRSGTVKGV
jgi:hypothetical protein